MAMNAPRHGTLPVFPANRYCFTDRYCVFRHYTDHQRNHLPPGSLFVDCPPATALLSLTADIGPVCEASLSWVAVVRFHPWFVHVENDRRRLGPSRRWTVFTVREPIPKSYIQWVPAPWNVDPM